VWDRREKLWDRREKLWDRGEVAFGAQGGSPIVNFSTGTVCAGEVFILTCPIWIDITPLLLGGPAVK